MSLLKRAWLIRDWRQCGWREAIRDARKQLRYEYALEVVRRCEGTQ